MPESSVDVWWTVALAATGVEAPARTSSLSCPFVIVRYAALSAAASAGRAHAAYTPMNPPGEGVRAAADEVHADATTATVTTRRARDRGMGRASERGTNLRSVAPRRDGSTGRTA